MKEQQQNLLLVCEELEPRGLTGDPILDFFCPGKGGRYYIMKNMIKLKNKKRQYPNIC